MSLPTRLPSPTSPSTAGLPAPRAPASRSGRASQPQRAGARQVLLLASKAALIRPRAHAQDRQRLRGSVRGGPAARPPTRKQAEAPEARRQEKDCTGRKPGVALVRALTTNQAFDDIPDCRVVGAGVRQYIRRGDVAKQVLRPRRCAVGQQNPSLFVC